jgi:hypothetical protein
LARILASALLSPGSGSDVDELTVAVLSIQPEPFLVTVVSIVTVADAPGARVPRAHVTVLDAAA